MTTPDLYRRIVGKVGPKASTRFDGVLNLDFFADVACVIEELAEMAIERAEKNRPHGPYDPMVLRRPGSPTAELSYPEDADLTEYVGRISIAYYKFFGQEPGISTDDRSKRGGPFVRFAQATSGVLGVPLSPDQIRNRFRQWKGRNLSD
jgi:hypothetical protein